MPAPTPSAQANRDQALRLIERIHRGRPLGLVFWSGGKDSMVLLHLMRSAGLNLPVAFFREPWQPRKYSFHDQLIRDWELHVLSWHPTAVAFQQTDCEMELQNLYRFGSSEVTCPTGIVPPVDGLPWACMIDMSQRPLQERLDVPQDFQAAWIGHKGCDVDAVLGGDAGTRAHAVMAPNGSVTVFPLKDWSHDDIWEYIEGFDVPYDSERYEKTAEGAWRERPDRRHNADYVHACSLCVDRRPEAPRFVHCPKLDATVANVSHRLEWVEPQKMHYMVDDPEDLADGAPRMLADVVQG